MNDDKFEITIIEEKQSINDEFMDDINMDINDYIKVDNKDYNLNTLYEEVLKNLEDINISRDNVISEKEIILKLKIIFINNFFNTKPRKRKSECCSSDMVKTVKKSVIINNN